ncbi:MAG TPA: helix-turn-helix domain-containing protein [Chloroflexota bacterium]|nr:helix-turn-helix domain-containing protein [Chloroflexota bacterium]
MEPAASSGETWYFGREAEQRVERIRRYRSGLERSAFGAALKRLRLRQKMTQRDLAAALHLPPIEVAAIESGECAPRSFDEILWVGAALGLNVVETNQLLRADERRELDEEERILFIKLRLQLAYPFLEQQTESPFDSCYRCGAALGQEHRCPRCGSRALQ